MTDFEEAADQMPKFLHQVRERETNGVTVMGIAPGEPDDIPVQPASGFVWMQGSAWFGHNEAYGLTKVRVSNDGESIDLEITLDDALSLRSLLDDCIDAMREAEAFPETVDEP